MKTKKMQNILKFVDKNDALQKRLNTRVKRVRVAGVKIKKWKMYHLHLHLHLHLHPQ